MNASKLSTVERLAEELVARLTIELEASGRHVHLSRADVETLVRRGLPAQPDERPVPAGAVRLRRAGDAGGA